jgi:Uncharacterized protein containing a von Willebrand factor type A (vWA) domain
MSKIENTKMLEKFVATKARGSHPVPLKETAYDIEVNSGMATVKQTRRFRNDEKRPIEAVLTFPVAFDAVVTSLECDVAGRRLKGQAQAKKKARETYESAIDNGKTAVLHEELLRGLHMVSVANVAPDAEIVVTATYVMPISISPTRADFRVPLTIGQIFGQLPLPDSDQVALGGQNGDVKVSIRSNSGVVYVNGELPTNGVSMVKLNDVIEVRVEELAIESLGGTAADGRHIRLDFAPAFSGENSLDVDVMVDTSGSMGEQPTGRLDRSVSKAAVVVDGLRRAFATFGEADVIRLWEFNDDCKLLGSGNPASVLPLLNGIAARNRGTNLAEAVAKTVASRQRPQILLITDGRAGRMIDIQAAVAAGARVTVVLVGNDALEVNVGYLAAQSGGQMFVVAGADADRAIEAALQSMRVAASPAEKIEGELNMVTRSLSGVSIEATWGSEGGREVEGVAALAAHLAMSSLDEDRAGALAAAEGIVSHLTSIVLVDEEGATLEDLPEQRKVGLPDSALGTAGFATFLDAGATRGVQSLGLAASARPSVFGAFRSASRGGIQLCASGYVGDEGHSMLMGLEEEDEDVLVFNPPKIYSDISGLPIKGYLEGVGKIFKTLDWNAFVGELTSVPLGTLPASASISIIRIATLNQFTEASKATAVDAQSLAVGILALLFAPTDRTAQRIARKILGSVPQNIVDDLKRAVEAGL